MAQTLVKAPALHHTMVDGLMAGEHARGRDHIGTQEARAWSKVQACLFYHNSFLRELTPKNQYQSLLRIVMLSLPIRLCLSKVPPPLTSPHGEQASCTWPLVGHTQTIAVWHYWAFLNHREEVQVNYFPIKDREWSLYFYGKRKNIKK
jgi:hypothetical protein